MKPEIKKLLILNAPYLLFVYLFDKVGQAVRLAPGADMSAKLLSIGDGFSAAFSNAFPSVHPADLLIGLAGAVIVRLAVYIKGKNAKKYRKGIEYGSARWGKAEDIKPYIDPVFQNNVLLTQTERLTMNSRPKQPKYARNKNILVIGGSGSGKTRFFVKPNLMQMHYPCDRRLRLRQDKVFCEAEPHANALKLCCYRPERHRLNRVRKALAARRLQDKSAEYDKLQEIHAI